MINMVYWKTMVGWTTWITPHDQFSHGPENNLGLHAQPGNTAGQVMIISEGSHTFDTGNTLEPKHQNIDTDTQIIYKTVNDEQMMDTIDEAVGIPSIATRISESEGQQDPLTRPRSESTNSDEMYGCVVQNGGDTFRWWCRY